MTSTQSSVNYDLYYTFPFEDGREMLMIQMDFVGTTA